MEIKKRKHSWAKNKRSVSTMNSDKIKTEFRSIECKLKLKNFIFYNSSQSQFNYLNFIIFQSSNDLADLNSSSIFVSLSWELTAKLSFSFFWGIFNQFLLFILCFVNLSNSFFSFLFLFLGHSDKNVCLDPNQQGLFLGELKIIVIYWPKSSDFEFL